MLRELAHERTIARGQALRGAAVSGETLYVWGRDASAYPLNGAKARIVAKGDFGPGGCAALGGLVLHEQGRLVFVSPDGRKEQIDEEPEPADCIEAPLFGRRGVLVIHRHAQLRFYQRATEAWRYQELYSIYTPSEQAGLALADIDGDGRTDILCGNYWVRSPERPGLPWHVFAINTWFENPLSATLRLAWTGSGLFAAQAALAPGRLAWFARPANPEQLWLEVMLAGDLARPQALAAGDFNGDGRMDVFVGENNGARSRWFVWWGDGGGKFRREQIGEGRPLIGAWAAGGGLVLAGPSEVVSLEYQRRR